MLPDELFQYLNQENPDSQDPLHGKLLVKAKALVKLSRDKMATYYKKWDKYDASYRTERDADADDRKAADKKEPVKMTLPLTYSQVNTFVAFCYQVFTQRPAFYELTGSGAENIQGAKLGESALEYNLDHNKFKGVLLQQWLLDIGRFGLGVFKHSWVTEMIKTEQPVPMQVGQVPGASVLPPTTMQMVDKIKYQGNKVVVISPYRFFPDPRVPITRFQEGEFCASEDEYSEHALRKMQGQKMVAGVDFVKQMTVAELSETDRRVSFADSIRDQGVLNIQTSQAEKFYIITEVQLELIPANWTLNGKPLGTSKDAEKWILWYANDSRIIRLEPMGYLHSQFTYDLSQFNNDQIRFINFGVSELLEQLQDVQNWFINARVANVRSIIGNKLIVDPKGVEMQDLRDRAPIIRLKAAVQGSGVDRWITQLQLQDVTTGHVKDAETFESFAKNATGITDNLLGQFASGRRSATEARNVNNSAAARLLLTAYSMWEMALLPLGRHMLSNIRDGMDVQQLVRVVGQSNLMDNQAGLQTFLPVDKTLLLGDYDFLLFDGTLPSQRGAQAQTLEELLINLLQKPELVFVLGIDPRPLFREIMLLRGIRNLDQFNLTPQSAQQLIQLVGVARNANAAGQTGPGGGQPDQNNPQPTSS